MTNINRFFQLDSNYPHHFSFHPQLASRACSAPLPQPDVPILSLAPVQDESTGLGAGFYCGKIWIIGSSLKGGKAYIASGSSGQRCPAHSRNGVNQKFGFKDWLFNHAKGIAKTGEEWTEGGVVVKCSVHDG